MWNLLNSVVASGQPLIIIRTREQLRRVHEQINEICAAQNPPRAFLYYTPPSGLVELNPESGEWSQLLEPNAPIGRLSQYIRDSYHRPFVLHLEEAYLWWGGQAQFVLRQLAAAFRDVMKTLIITIPPGTEIPASYEAYATVLDHPVPGEDEIEVLVSDVLDHNEWLTEGNPLLAIENSPRVVQALRGLTEGFAEAALLEAISRAGQELQPQDFKNGTLWEFLLQAIRQWKSRQAQSGGRIVLLDPKDFPPDLAGFDFLKEEVRALRETGALEVGHPLFPRMMVLLGLPGGGKSVAVVLMGQWTGLPVYDARVEEMVGSGVVGSMERSFAATLEDAKMVAPCILRIDELEKVIGGAASSNRSDSGSLNRATQILLKFAQEDAAKYGIWLAVTMNSTDVRPEDIRLGRSYGIYFVDVPDEPIRADAARIQVANWLGKVNAWNRAHGRPEIQVAGDISPQWLASITEGWMPAEIETLLQKALVHGRGRRIDRATILKAKEAIAPMAVVMPEKVASLREFGREVPSVAYGMGQKAHRRVIPAPPGVSEETKGEEQQSRGDADAKIYVKED